MFRRIAENLDSKSYHENSSLNNDFKSFDFLCLRLKFLYELDLFDLWLKLIIYKLLYII